jgi:hypothetical protein
MGGLAVDPSSFEKFVPGNHQPTLTAKGVSLLLKCEPDLVPDISEKNIKDKSKGGSFTKFVACTQAAWFCATCVTRLAQQLPISQLELNTFAHALCTVIIYWLWWRKPLDVETPLLITDERIQPLLAYMWMSSKTSALEQPSRLEMGSITYTIGESPEFEAIKLQPHGEPASNTSGHQDFTRNRDRTQPKVRVTPTESLEGTDFYVNYDSTRWVVQRHEHTMISSYTITRTTTGREPAYFDLAPADVRRWNLARQAMDKYGLEKPGDDLRLLTVELVPEVDDGWTSIFRIRGQDGNSWATTGFLILAVVYGGLHGIAWDTKFPSDLQRTLWRAATITIAGPSALILLSGAVTVAFLHLRRHLRRSQRSKSTNPESNSEMSTLPPLPRNAEETEPGACASTNTESTLVRRLSAVLVMAAWFVAALSVMCFGVLYTAARGYVVFESFRTVFYLPPGAYIAIKWSQYVPHIA